MTIQYRLRLAFSALRANKSRSGLTILGIVIGIMSIMIVMSVSQGGASLILSEIQGIGATTIVIEPGRQPSGPSDFAQMLADSLKERDIEALRNKSNVPNLVDATPEVVTSVTVSHEGETFRSTVIGTAPEWIDYLNTTVADGVFISDDDVRQRASVVVIGSEVSKELFGLSNPIGEKVKIKDRNFRVIGVFGRMGQGLFNVDSMVVVPYTTAQQYLTGTTHFNEILTRADSEVAVERTVRDIEVTLRDLHGITDPEKDDFHVSTQEDALETVGMITGILSALLVSVAAISLLVGGIGIMNIMLVSVTERTQEIGLRKAVGAKNADILSQFLIEAVLLTVLGGAIGMILGALVTFLMSIILSQVLSVSWPFVFPVSAAAIGFGVSAAIGVVFGLYPASQAAKKNPIEALRHE